MRHEKTSHPSRHLGPPRASVFCSVTHGCDVLSAAATAGTGVCTLWTSSPPLQQTFAQPWNTVCVCVCVLADASLLPEFSAAPEQECSQ